MMFFFSFNADVAELKEGSDRTPAKTEEEEQGASLESEGHIELKEGEEDEDDFSDILSSDSDTSSLDEFRAQLEAGQESEERKGKRWQETVTAKEEDLERMYFYSIYIDQLPSKRKSAVKPQTSEGIDDCRPYGTLIKEAKDADSARFVIDEFDEEKFNDLLKSDINEDEGMEDIDGNVSIRTMCEKNFSKLRMDGPTRRIVMLFSYKEEEKPISFSLLKFMHLQKGRFPFMTGVNLYFKGAGIGIHVVEGSEYILLMHFPFFFKDDSFKKMSLCKVLAVEQLSPMKYFEQYSCYKAKPVKSKTAVPKSLKTYEEAEAFMKNIGKNLDTFFKYVYSDFPSVTTDNELPDDINNDLPSVEALQFALNGNWLPGLREARHWYAHATIVPGEIDDSDYCWPIRSDGMPDHIMHPAPGEEDSIRDAMLKALKEKKMELLPQFQPKKDVEGEAAPSVPQTAARTDDDEFEGVKGVVSKSSLYDDEKLDGDLEDLLEAEELSDDD